MQPRANCLSPPTGALLQHPSPSPAAWQQSQDIDDSSEQIRNSQRLAQAQEGPQDQVGEQQGTEHLHQQNGWGIFYQCQITILQRMSLKQGGLIEKAQGAPQ
jgi:hypothetical protein